MSRTAAPVITSALIDLVTSLYFFLAWLSRRSRRLRSD